MLRRRPLLAAPHADHPWPIAIGAATLLLSDLPGKCRASGPSAKPSCPEFARKRANCGLFPRARRDKGDPNATARAGGETGRGR
jgi:hypothetical protein